MFKGIKGLVKNTVKKIPHLELLYWSLMTQKTQTINLIRLQEPVTKLLGPKYLRSKKYIEIDITYRCNLNCFNCNRSCRQTPSHEQMTIEQIQKFIKESVDSRINWKRIRILGGEPTLHRDIFLIIDLLLEYKNDYSRDTKIEIVTNSFGKEADDIIAKIPKNIRINTYRKKSVIQFFHPFNVAPIDCILYKYADYINGCATLPECGIGLTPYGYYPCAVAGSIDRVFGFDKGRKKIPSPDDLMTDQTQIFCKFCGHFRYTFLLTTKEIMSPTWKRAYEKYKVQKPILSLY